MIIRRDKSITELAIMTKYFRDAKRSRMFPETVNGELLDIVIMVNTPVRPSMGRIWMYESDIRELFYGEGR